METMAETQLYMQCEEEELAPCQSIMEEMNETINVYSEAQDGYITTSPPPTNGFPEASPLPPSVEVPGQTTVLPIVDALPSAVSKPILPNVLQSVQVAAPGTTGPPIYLAPQGVPDPAQSLGTPVGYILPAGQSVTFLTPAQAAQLITPQIASSCNKLKDVPQGNSTSLEIPVTLTIRGPSGVQSITTVASARTMPGLGPPSSNLLSLSSPSGSGAKMGITTPLPSAPLLASNQVGCPPAVRPAKAVTVQATVAITDPSKILPGCSKSNPFQKLQRNSAPSTAVSTKVFKNASRLPQVCSHCDAPYKAVQSLRGYLCQCNSELINSIQALSVRLRKRKPRRSSAHRSPNNSSCSPTSSRRHPEAAASSPPPLKHITTSEIPEGDPSPGTGDYDKLGRLIILIEDFYYGRDPGRPVLIESNQVPITMKCHLCEKKLKNNIKLMNHMKHHMELERQNGEEDCHTVCQHCFRNFITPFSLQCHVETVHSQVESTALCKICELSFENEPVFLNHMKNSHKPGEMPYSCQVCNFRSSFYHDVIIHFRELHKDTNNLLCPYCLKVFKSSSSYQIHYSKHQKKSVLHCNKCRLQFLYSKDKMEHKTSYHQTHLKPVQLLGLKPGTKVTIRAYSVTKVDDSTGFKAPNKHTQSSPTRVTSPASPPTPLSPQGAVQNIRPLKRKPVESMLEIMTKFQSQCEPAKKRFCMECNFEIPDFSCHFPTFVRCSLCHYCTCCSRAYANHMISNHVTRKTTTKYLNLYKPCPKVGRLKCKFCNYTTEIGDSMAKHLVEHRGHNVSHCKFSDGFSRGFKRFVFIPTDLIRGGQGANTGTFMPLHVIQVGLSSVPHPTQLVPQPNNCINLPVSSGYAPSIPIQVQPVDQSTLPDENCGTEPKDSTQQNSVPHIEAHSEPEGSEVGSLTVAQLRIVLYGLCFGIPQAANHFDTQPEDVQSLLLKCRSQLGVPKCKEHLTPNASDQLAEWVLSQREQQLPVDESNLFAKAFEFMSTDAGSGFSYKWAVDFLLHRDLAVQALATSTRLLPHPVQKRARSFTRFINKHIALQGFGQSSIGAMDELSIFIDTEQLDPTSADSSSMLAAFKMVGETDPLIEVVLAALADGTMLPTLLFLKGEPLNPAAPALPDDIILEANPEGFSDEERLQIWFDKIWRPHVGPSTGGKGLLVTDTYRGHITDDFLASLNSANTLPVLVPCACSSRLQPLEACVGPVLREFLQARWSQHVTNSPQDLIGAEPADLALLISAWLIEMMDVLAAKPDLLLRSFELSLNCPTDGASSGFSELVHTMTEALIVTTLLDEETEEAETVDKGSTPCIPSPKLLPSSPVNPLAMKKIFDKDRDLESFHGFEEADTVGCSFLNKTA